jgi:hypothetical protein
MRRLYERLDLGDFETARPHLERYLAETSRYERNKWQLSEAERSEIERHWGEVIRKYGYGQPRRSPADAAEAEVQRGRGEAGGPGGCLAPLRPPPPPPACSSAT